MEAALYSLDVDQVRQYQNGWTAHDNPDFIQYIRHHWLVKPSHSARRKKNKSKLALQKKQNEDVSQYGQSSFVDEQLQKIENGFFVECGAADGVSLSNTLFFEQARNWTGLLIEANPDLFQSMLTSGRNAYMMNACLGISTTSERVTFQNAGLLGGIIGQTYNT